MAQENKAQSEIRYLNPVSVDVKKKKIGRASCRERVSSPV